MLIRICILLRLVSIVLSYEYCESYKKLNINDQCVERDGGIEEMNSVKRIIVGHYIQCGNETKIPIPWLDDTEWLDRLEQDYKDHSCTKIVKNRDGYLCIDHVPQTCIGDYYDIEVKREATFAFMLVILCILGGMIFVSLLLCSFKVHFNSGF